MNEDEKKYLVSVFIDALCFAMAIYVLLTYQLSLLYQVLCALTIPIWLFSGVRNMVRFLMAGVEVEDLEKK